MLCISKLSFLFLNFLLCFQKHNPPIWRPFTDTEFPGGQAAISPAKCNHHDYRLRQHKTCGLTFHFWKVVWFSIQLASPPWQVWLRQRAAHHSIGRPAAMQTVIALRILLSIHLSNDLSLNVNDHRLPAFYVAAWLRPWDTSLQSHVYVAMYFAAQDCLVTWHDSPIIEHAFRQCSCTFPSFSKGRMGKLLHVILTFSCFYYLRCMISSPPCAVLFVVWVLILTLMSHHCIWKQQYIRIFSFFPPNPALPVLRICSKELRI